MPGTSIPDTLGTGAPGTGIPGTVVPDMTTVLQSAGSAIPSPTGAMGVDAPIGGAGIPLGTTELFAGGLHGLPRNRLGFCGRRNLGDLHQRYFVIRRSLRFRLQGGSLCRGRTARGDIDLGNRPVFAGGRVRLATALGTTGLVGIIGVPAPGSLSTCNIPGSLATGMDSPGLRPLSGMTPPNTC
jgi:hypothetical protein